MTEMAYDNRCLKQEVTRLKNEQVMDRERIDQQHHLLRQARDETSKMEDQHQRELDKVYRKLNEVQSGGKRLTDEEVQGRMRRLEQYLESWVTMNFKDSAKLEYAFGQMDFPHTSTQRRALIQAFVVALISEWIFLPSRFGILNESCEHILNELEAGVQRSKTLFHSWRGATGVAIEELTGENHEYIFTQIADDVEAQFGISASTEAEPRTQKLKNLLQKCADLKNSLCRGPDVFTFFSSRTGTEFSPDWMTSVGGDGETGGTMGLCLWPALYKHSESTPPTLIERELVWKLDKSCPKVTDVVPPRDMSEPGPQESMSSY
ncbi:uncharacterized protein BDV17DRAFT_300368 [Aspergillus undulatus]|uniref:uncharacterized protein n=1 Tax=Aspergillus undulatus TaxID=1810928 RepID=UPI003CCCD954